MSDKFVSTIPGGPEVVGVVESTLLHLSGHHPTPFRPYHQDRCIFAGLGSDLQWQDNRGTLECGGGRTTHQWPRAQGSHPHLEVIPERGREVTTPDTVFQDIIRHFYVPEVDLFASRLNHQLPLYVSRQPDPGAKAVDAFQLD